MESLKGDQTAIAAVSGLLEHEDVNVRLDSVGTLMWMAGKGDPQAISALGARLEDRHLTPEEFVFSTGTDWYQDCQSHLMNHKCRHEVTGGGELVLPPTLPSNIPTLCAWTM